jgi:hypothetical protein
MSECFIGANELCRKKCNLCSDRLKRPFFKNKFFAIQGSCDGMLDGNIIIVIFSKKKCFAQVPEFRAQKFKKIGRYIPRYSRLIRLKL